MIALPPPAIVWAAKDDAPQPEVWALEQLRIDGATDAAKVDKLADAHSLKQAIAILDKLNVPFVHATATLHADKLPSNIRTQIAALPQGEPFVLPDGKYISINVIVGRTPPPAAISIPPQVSLLTPARRA
jgi:peptidyl-prolyl cis-trans isomerase C